MSSKKRKKKTWMLGSKPWKMPNHSILKGKGKALETETHAEKQYKCRKCNYKAKAKPVCLYGNPFTQSHLCPPLSKISPSENFTTTAPSPPLFLIDIIRQFTMHTGRINVIIAVPKTVKKTDITHWVSSSLEYFGRSSIGQSLGPKVVMRTLECPFP